MIGLRVGLNNQTQAFQSNFNRYKNFEMSYYKPARDLIHKLRDSSPVLNRTLDLGVVMLKMQSQKLLILSLRID